MHPFRSVKQRSTAGRLVPALVLVLGVLAFALPATAGDVTLAWDANAEPDLAGYRLYRGPASGSYSNSVDVGLATSHTLTGLEEGVTHFFAVTAVDLYGNESSHSNEVSRHFAVLVAIEVSGPAAIDDNGGAQYSCTATWSDGSTSDVTAQVAWSEDSQNASIDANGYLAAGDVIGDQAVLVSAALTAGDVTRSAGLSVTVRDTGDSVAPDAPTGLRLVN